MGSLAVMRLVQQDDQSQVAAAAESISEGLVKQLGSLNVGDALLVGQWVGSLQLFTLMQFQKRLQEMIMMQYRNGMLQKNTIRLRVSLLKSSYGGI